METLQVRHDLVAFHGDEKIKQKYLERVRGHRKADEIIQALTWSNGKGCAVGCTLHAYHHSAYEDELGIPVQLAVIQDGIFERLSLAEAKWFPERFLESIPVGADLYKALWEFALFVLLDEENGLISINNNDKEIELAAGFFQQALGGREISKGEYMDAMCVLDLPGTLSVMYMLDTIDVENGAFLMVDALDDLAIRDNEIVAAGLGHWLTEESFNRRVAFEARAEQWRDKLLECLSNAKSPRKVSAVSLAMAACV